MKKTIFGRVACPEAARATTNPMLKNKDLIILPFFYPSTTGTSTAEPSAQHIAPDPDAIAWVIAWQQMNTPSTLQDLLDAGAIVRTATKPFSISNASGPMTFSEGSLVLLAGLQDVDKTGSILEILGQADVNVHSYNSQLTTNGPGLGTSHFKKVPVVKPLLIVGPGTRSYDAGEAWFQLDQRLGVAPVMVDMNRLKTIDLHDYTHLLMVEGRYGDIKKGMKEDISAWVSDGGILVAIQGAATWAESLCFEADGCNEEENGSGPASEQAEPAAYADFDDQRAQRTIGGAIVGAKIDKTHPIAFGYDSELPLFRRGSTLLEASENPFTTPVHYQES